MRSVIALMLMMLAPELCGCISELLTAEMPLSITAPDGDPIDGSGQSKLEGVYYLSRGSDSFGDTLVALWERDHLCFFAGSQVIFAEFAGATRGDTARFNGYYRFVRSAITGSVVLSIMPAEGGASLHDGTPDAPITIRGTYADPNAGRAREIVLERRRSLMSDSSGFRIIGHAAGGRNSERLGRSENSIPMARFSEYLGCTGVEVDLHITSDGEIILMHDDTFSPRTVNSTYILGNVEDFSLQQIRDNARLIHGEQIPTLKEFLDFIIDSTKLELVWLDPKVSNGVERVLEIQRAAVTRAANRTPRLQILFGIPSLDVLDVYRRAPLADSTDVLCELSPDIVRSLHSCKAWGPRWTNGVQASTVAALRSEGYAVYPWTIDSPEYMTQFLSQATFDGILSNYPCMLTGLYCQRNGRPR